MLQRSVTLIRRLLWTRPNESMRRSLALVGVMAGPISVVGEGRNELPQRFSIPEIPLTATLFLAGGAGVKPAGFPSRDEPTPRCRWPGLPSSRSAQPP